MFVSASTPVTRPSQVQPAYAQTQAYARTSAPTYAQDATTFSGRQTGPVKVSTVVFMNGHTGGPTVQVVSLLRMAHDAVNVRDTEMAKLAYTRAIFVARTTDDFVGIVQHAAARNHHQSAKDALFAGKGHTQDVNLLLRLANTGAIAGYKAQTTDIYQSAIAASTNFYQLNVIAQHAEHNGYTEPARQARLKAISLA